MPSEAAPKVEAPTVERVGGYLCYSPDSMGTLYLHWSEKPIDKALAFFEAGKKVPPFKFKTNQGRFTLTKGVDDKGKFYEGWGAFLKEGLCRYNANTVEVMGKNDARENVQVALLNRGDHKVVRVTEGESWSGDAKDLASFAVVGVDNQTFQVGTLEQTVFMSKAKLAGCGHDLQLAA